MSLRTVVVVVCVTLLAAGLFGAGYIVRGAVLAAPVSAAHDSTVVAVAAQAHTDTLWRIADSTAGVSLATYQNVRRQLDSALTHTTTPDSVIVTRFVDACDRFATDCATARDAAIALHQADSVVIARQQAELRVCATPTIPTAISRWRDRIGLYAGYGLSSSALTRPGVLLGVGVRLWP